MQLWNAIAGSSARALAVARIGSNMRAHGFPDSEVATFARAYSGGTKQDQREAFWIFDRARRGELPCTELEQLLIEILGVDAADSVHRQMHRVVVSVHADREERRATQRLGRKNHSSDGAASGGSATFAPADAGPPRVPVVTLTEFGALVAAIAREEDGRPIAASIGQGVGEWFVSLGEAVHTAVTELAVISPLVTVQLPPSVLPRAGRITQRMLEAGFSSKQAGVALVALFARRETRTVLQLWGLFDTERNGSIAADTFDHALQLFVEIDDEQLGLLRTRMGFVDQANVSFREFEAALRLLVPESGARPDLRRLQQKVKLTDLLGGPAAVARLQAFQRQRAQRLAQRMFTFGYDNETIRLVVKTLFVSRLHNKDLWQLWVFLSQGRTEVPLAYAQLKHMLALLSDEADPKQLQRLIEKVDSNHSGDIEFEEFSILLRALNPQSLRTYELDEVRLETHHLIDQVQALLDEQWPLMHAQPWHAARQTERAALLTAALPALEAHVGGTGSHEATLWALEQLRRVAALQVETVAEAEGEARGSLASYVQDSYANALCKLSQAIDASCKLLAEHGNDSYECHVALRTLRTAVEIEQLQPSRSVEWRMPVQTEVVRNQRAEDKKSRQNVTTFDSFNPLWEAAVQGRGAASKQPARKDAIGRRRRLSLTGLPAGGTSCK